MHYFDHGANQRARGVVLTAVTAGIAHVLDFSFIEVAEFVLFLLGAEAQFIDLFQRITQGIAALNFVFDLAEDLTDLVFDGVGVISDLFEAPQVREQLAIDVIDQVITGQGIVVVEMTVGVFGGSPSTPAVLLIDDVLVFFTHKLGTHSLFLL